MRCSIIDSVYRIDTDNSVSKTLDKEVTFPNGILVPPDDHYLYIADNDSRKGGKRLLVRFNLDKYGNARSGSRKILYDWGTDLGPDGILSYEKRVYTRTSHSSCLKFQVEPN